MADPIHRPSGLPPRGMPDQVEPRYSQHPGAAGLPVEIGNALQSLSRASRSFTLYDPHNDAVKQLIGDYKERSAALMRNTPIALEVLPFEITWNGSVVYHEPDRERSLAFRLFRDGVRGVRFEDGLTWNELIVLLEVLSVRCNSFRQQEEDLVTLLRKAAFRGIVIESVEGYVPDEERPENAALAPAAEDLSEIADPPADWDQPLPQPGAAAKVQFVPVADDALEALRAEELPRQLPAQAVQAVTQLLRIAQHLRDPRLRDELVPFVEEVQEYLLVERNVADLASLAVEYQEAFGDGRPLPGLQDERAFSRLLRAVPEDTEQVPQELFSLLAAVPGAHLGRALDMLELGPRGARRKALLSIVRSGAAQEPGVLLERMPAAKAALARDLFTILGKVAPDRTVDAAFELLEHPDPEFLAQLVPVIARAPRGLRLVRGLQTLMASPHEQVRSLAVGALGEIGGAKAIPLLAEHARRLAAKGMSLLEADVIGAAMARASAEDAQPVFLEWARPVTGLRSLLGRLSKDTPADRVLAYVAIAGLEVCPGRACEAAISAVLSGASGELAERCRLALEHRAGGTSHG